MDAVLLALGEMEMAFDADDITTFQRMTSIIKNELTSISKTMKEKDEKLVTLHLKKRDLEIENSAMKFILQIVDTDKFKNLAEFKEAKDLEIQELQNHIVLYQDTIMVMTADSTVYRKEIEELKERLGVYQETRKVLDKEIERLKAGSSDPNLEATIILLKQKNSELQNELGILKLDYMKLFEISRNRLDEMDALRSKDVSHTANEVLLKEQIKNMKSEIRNLEDIIARKELEASNLFKLLKDERNK